MVKKIVENKNIRLVKCSACGKAFYLKTKSKGKFKIKCPYCEQDVEIIINGENKNDSSRPSKS